MSTENLGVASSEAGLPSASVAPAEIDNSVNTSIESTSEANASVSTQPSENVVPKDTTTKQVDGAGIKNLRAYAEGLKKDLERYKPIYEQVDELGGLDALKPLVESHNTFVSQTPEEYKQSGVYQTLTGLYEANPINFGILVEALVDTYSEGIKQQLAKNDPEYQALLRLKQETEDEYNIPDDELDEDIPVHKELKRLRKFEADTLAARQVQNKQTTEAAQTERVTNLKGDLLGDAMTALGKTQEQVSPELFDKIFTQFQSKLDNNQELSQLYDKLERQAKDGIKFALGDTQKVKRLINNILTESINSVSQAKTSSTQKTNQPRIEVSPQTNNVVQKKNLPSADDPNFVDVVAADWAKRFGWPT